MSNRILRDWTDSEKINLLTVQAERFFVRLIMKVDDYGRFSSDTRLLKANLFPLLLDQVREADISRWIAECKKAGLIVLYEHTNKRFLQINDFKQRLDRAKAKFPPPPDNDSLSIDNELPPETETRNRNKKQETETEKNGVGIDSNVLLFPEKLNKINGFNEKWNEWLNFRKSKNKKISEKAQEKQLEFLNLQTDPIEVINQSIRNDWQGLFELKNKLSSRQETIKTNFSSAKNFE